MAASGYTVAMPSSTPMPARTLSERALNRALLARQLLLERADRSIPEALVQVAGLQTQYAPSGYVGLWTRLRDFRRDDLTAALEDRSAIQATLMRTTIHLVARDDYWPYTAGVREARRAWWLRSAGGDPVENAVRSERLRAALADGPRTIKELGPEWSGFIGTLSLWLDLVRVPPSGTWERRRADRLALADAWIGPDTATEEDGLDQLVRGYLRAFGPAPWRDIASWAGVPVGDLKRGAAERVDLVEYRDEDGRELLDLPGAPLPDADTLAPVRFLPHWDANLLVHARRTGVLPEAHRSKVFSTKNPFSVGVVLVDGRGVAAWSLRDGRIVVDPFEEIRATDRKAVEREREALEAFHA